MAKNNPKNSWLFIIIMVLLIITLSLGGYVVYLLSSSQVSQVNNANEMKWNPPEGAVKIDSIRVEGSTVVITNKCKAIAAETSPERALAILNALGNKTGERPDIYESTSSVIQSFGIKLEGVYVYKVEGDTYYADSYFRVGNKILQLDMKPSDAMSVALRSGSPVYYKQSLFDDMGVKVC